MGVSEMGTFVYTLQQGAKTKLSRSKVEVHNLRLTSLRLGANKLFTQPMMILCLPAIRFMASSLVRALYWSEIIFGQQAIHAGILIEQNGRLYAKDGEVVSRFGFHNLGRHSLATFLMDEQENPAVVQAVLRQSKMDMTLYYSHSSRKAKRAAVENYAKKIVSEAAGVQHAQGVN